MSQRNDLKARRAELLVQLFLEDAAPAMMAKAESRLLPFDFVIGLKGQDRSIRNFAVEVKQSDRPIHKRFHFLVDRRQRDYLSGSDMPVVVFAVDTKHNKLYYGLGSNADTVNSARRANVYELSVPVKEAQTPKAFVDDLVDDK